MPLVYDELRRLAAEKLAQEKPGQTLQATALVHEAYIRLVDAEKAQHWNGRGHFFAAAAEAMRRILVENARRKLEKRGGGRLRVDLSDIDPAMAVSAMTWWPSTRHWSNCRNRHVEGDGREVPLLRRADGATGSRGDRSLHLNCRQLLGLRAGLAALDIAGCTRPGD